MNPSKPLDMNNDIVWLQTPQALINMRNIDIIGFDTKVDDKENFVTIHMFFTGQGQTPVPIARMRSLKAAKKYMATLSRLIKQGAKCIDSNLIAEQCDNDPESEV
jgi:hypothetical protein